MKCWYCGKEEMLENQPGSPYLTCPKCFATWNKVAELHRGKDITPGQEETLRAMREWKLRSRTEGH